jgi:hypothetical protein
VKGRAAAPGHFTRSTEATRSWPRGGTRYAGPSPARYASTTCHVPRVRVSRPARLATGWPPRRDAARRADSHKRALAPGASVNSLISRTRPPQKTPITSVMRSITTQSMLPEMALLADNVKRDDSRVEPRRSGDAAVRRRSAALGDGTVSGDRPRRAAPAVRGPPGSTRGRVGLDA